jgi:DNA polymerase-1
MDVLIATSDKDMAQLVSERINLVDTMRGTRLDTAGVGRKFGVPPERIVDYLALMGDTSDNIPGVPGVGPKTAAKWLTQFGSLDAVMAQADTIKGKVGEKLKAHLEQLPLARKLATLHCDVPIELSVQSLRPTPPINEALRALYQRYEFRTWLRQLDGDAAANETQPEAGEKNYTTILDAAELDRWLTRLGDAELLAFDTETTGLDYMQAEIVGVSFAIAPREAAYVPLTHDYPGAPDQLNRDTVLGKLRGLLENPRQAKVGQNLKFDLHILANHGVALDGIRHDTMLESYVLDSTGTRHDMDSLAEKYLGETTIHYEEVAGKGARQLSFNQVPLEQAGPYAAEDADITLRLHQHLWTKLSDTPSLVSLYETLEIPLIPVLARIERNGVQIDGALLRRQSAELGKRLLELEQEAHREAGQPFNLGSPKQLQQILFEKQGLPITKKTPKGQPSTAEDVLQELALEYPLPHLIMAHRTLSKLKSTYTDKLPQQINPATGRVHTSYHQAVASTGRLSSSDPNLQNIPIRTSEGRRIRQAFVAPPGYRILAADYSQIELRIMAHLSGDPGLLDAFTQGHDIHRTTAAEVFGVPLDLVGPEQRRSAKAINFGLIYGMSAFGLARQLGIGRIAAQQYIDRYFARYPGVKRFMEDTRREAAEQGYVSTVFGRRLYLPEINSRNQQRRQAAERTAINAPMQGTAADIIKAAMIAVDGWLREQQPDARLVMQVHDELVLEVAENALEQTREHILRSMAKAADLRVPLVVEVGVGGNWDEAH